MSNEIKRHWQEGKYYFLLVLSTIILVVSCTSSVRELSQKRFMEMVKDHEIERVAIINDHTVEVRLAPGALASSKYKGLFDSEKQLKIGEPHFTMTISSEKDFRDELTSLNPTFPITTEQRSMF